MILKINIILRSPFNVLHSVLTITKESTNILIGERSKPLSDKLGGEICIVTRALVCIYLYIYAYGLTTTPNPRYMLRAQRGKNDSETQSNVFLVLKWQR